MHLLYVLSWRYWRHHLGTLLLTVLGVALGAAVFVAIQVANHSVLASFENSLDAVSGRANLQIDGGSEGIPDSLFLRIKKWQWRDSAIQAALPVVDASLYSPTLKNTVLVQGIDFFSAIDFTEPEAPRKSTEKSEFTLTKSTFALLTEPNTIAVGAELAKRAHLTVGDAIDFNIGAELASLQIVQILDTDQARRAFGGDFAVVDIATAQEILQRKDKLSRIDLIVQDDKLSQTAAALRQIVPPSAQVQRPAQRNEQVAGMLAAFQLNLTALSGVALFVGLFLVNNAIASSVVRRRHEVAILRTIGASRQQLMTLFQSEAAFMGLIGSCLGFLLGVAMAHWALGAVSKTVSSLYVEVRASEIHIPLWLYWGVPLGGTAMAWLASWISARESQNISPRMAFSTVSLHQTTRHNALPLAGIGASLIAIAAVLCIPNISRLSPWIGFAAAFLTLSGFALCCPLATLALGAIARKLSSFFANPMPQLASANLRLTLHRTSLVVAALAVALSLVGGLEIMVYSFRHSVELWIDQSFTGDLYISTARGFDEGGGPGLPDEVLQYIAEMPETAVVDTLRNTQAQIGNQPVSIAARDLNGVFAGRSKIPFKSTFAGQENALQQYHAGKVLFVSERFSNLLHKDAGDSVQLPTPQGTKNFQIAAVFYDYTPDAAVLYMPQSLYEKYWGKRDILGLALFLHDSQRAEIVKQQLEKYFSQRYQLSLVSNQQLRQNVMKTFDNTFAVTYALEAIALLVAALGTVQTMLALILERDLEIATLRSVGASIKQIALLLFSEMTLLALAAWGMALIMGMMLAWELIFVINQQFFGWTIFWRFPWSLPPRTLILMLIVSWIAGILPWRILVKRNLAHSLSNE